MICAGFVFVAAAFAAFTAASTEAPPLPSPQRGHELAEKFCTGCHVIDSASTATVPAGVPTFRGIANQPGQTGQNIMNVLIKPHAPMPDLQLTTTEIADINAYLESLRSNADVPPLLSPSAPSPKPVYPEPS